MIRRLFYMSLGAALALWAMRRLQALKPDHLARRAADGAAGMLAQVRDFSSDTFGEASEREIELRSRFGVDTVDGNN